MAQKNRTEKKPETTEIESHERPEEIVEMFPDEEYSSTEKPLLSVDTEKALTTEDLMDDMRRSLLSEEEIEKNQKESKWWRRIGKKKSIVEPEHFPENVEIDLPFLSAPTELVEDQEQKQEPDEDLDQIDDLVDLLSDGSGEVSVEATEASQVEVPSALEKQLNFEELKNHAFRSNAPKNAPESDVRSLALEGEEVFIEVQSSLSDPFEERLSAFGNALKSSRWYVNIALAFLTVVIALIALLVLFNLSQKFRPSPVKELSSSPYPTSVALPGGWSFMLGQGTLQEGKWNPRGAEWLEGTEICRWVSLPWSRQLEAVILTLKPKDPIELVMSNHDKLVYEVYSVRQLNLEELPGLDSNSPCLLLILIQSDSKEHWVLTALP